MVLGLAELRLLLSTKDLLPEQFTGVRWGRGERQQDSMERGKEEGGGFQEPEVVG